MEQVYDIQEECSYCKKPWKATPICFSNTCQKNSISHGEKDPAIHLQLHISNCPAFNNGQNIESLDNYINWFCEDCNQSFPNFLAFDIELHFKTYHPNKNTKKFNYSCPATKCAKTVLSLDSLKAHITQNPENHPSTSTELLASRKRKKSNIQKTRSYAYWHCTECKLSFRNLSAYQIENHINRIHPQLEACALTFRYSCKGCTDKNKSFSEIQSHLLTTHKKLFLLKKAKDFSKINNHWYCEYCKKYFKGYLAINIDKHLRNQHNDEEKTKGFFYQCSNRQCWQMPRNFHQIERHISNSKFHPKNHHFTNPLTQYALWYCEKCKAAYYNFTGYDVESHLVQVHQNILSEKHQFKYTCNGCPAYTPFSAMNLYELEMHHQSDHLSYFCPITPCIAPIKQTSQSLINHLIEAHLKWHCSWCDMEHDNQYLANKHIRVQHPLPFMKVK